MTITVVLVLLGTALLVGSQSNRGNRKQTRPPTTIDECALFKSNDTIALTQGKSSFIEIGAVDVGDRFSLSMEVMPSPLNHNGILFSVGSRTTFDYYEWKTAAVHTQFIVVEFIFSALALTVKAAGTEHLQQIEVYRTYPIPYSIDNARWHTVKAIRNGTEWKLTLDQLNQTSAVTAKTNVQLVGKPATIGGRPEYTNHQFQGIIRKLRINGRPVSLSGKRTGSSGMEAFVEVWHCSHTEVTHFEQWMLQSRINPHN